jgi:hypothetical protein
MKLLISTDYAQFQYPDQKSSRRLLYTLLEETRRHKKQDTLFQAG